MFGALQCRQLGAVQVLRDLDEAPFIFAVAIDQAWDLSAAHRLSCLEAVTPGDEQNSCQVDLGRGDEFGVWGILARIFP
ncbi:MAG: hypothetical protein WDN46_00840 [Methylocella sp.]